MNFLSALALINNGVREILPFIRYISQYVDFEFNAIRGQDKGKGVVCAATWYVNSLSVLGDSLKKTLFFLFIRIMPVALVTSQVLVVYMMLY
jgi:hypothetical protein